MKATAMKAPAGKRRNTQQAQPMAARERLLAQREELLRQLHAGSNALAALDKIADDDHARILHDQFVSLRVGRLAYEQIKLIDAALARLDAAEYGICVDCECPISPKRLAAIPWANRCVACQERAAQSEEDAPYAWRAA